MNWLDKFIVSERGQWDYPGYPTAVPTKNGRITMEGVPYPVMGFVPGQPPVMMQPGKNYKFPGKMVYEIPIAQKGLQTSSDSLAHQLNKIADYEYARGSASGTGLSNFGNPALGNNPTKQQAVDWMMQNTYPIVSPYFVSPTEEAEAVDFVYNTGRDPRVYMLDQYLKSIGQSGLPNRGSYNIDMNDPSNSAKWKTKKGELDKVWNEYYDDISKLSENDRRILLNKGRDFYYRNINVKPDGSPSDAYYNTWYGRIWNTNDYTPFDPNNPKFIAPRKKEGGHIVPGRYRNPEGNWLSKYQKGGFHQKIYTDPVEEDLRKQGAKNIPAPDFRHGGWLDKYQKGKEVKEETYRTPWWNPEKPSEWNPAWTSDRIRQNAQAEFPGTYVLPTVEIVGEKPQRFKDQEAAAAIQQNAVQTIPDRSIIDITNIQDPERAYDDLIDNFHGSTRNVKYNDTLIDITDRPMGWFNFNTIPGQTYTEILGNNYIEVNRDETGRPEDYAKNWKTRMQNPKDIFRNREYAEETGSYYHSKDIPAFYGIENGRFKVGKPEDFQDSTVIVPIRNSTVPYSKIGIEKGLFKDNMYTYDKDGNKIWNLRNKQKFFVHSPVTKKTVFISKDSKSDLNSEKSLDFTKKSLEEFAKNNPEAYIIPLDEGRYRAYMSSPEGLDDESFKRWNAFSGTILQNYLEGIGKDPIDHGEFTAGSPLYSPVGNDRFGYNIGLLKQKHGGWLDKYQGDNKGTQVNNKLSKDAVNKGYTWSDEFGLMAPEVTVKPTISPEAIQSILNREAGMSIAPAPSSFDRRVSQAQYIMANPFDAFGNYVKQGYVPQGNLGNYGMREKSSPVGQLLMDFNPYNWANAGYRAAIRGGDPNTYTTLSGAGNMGTDLLEALPVASAFGPMYKSAQTATQVLGKGVKNLPKATKNELMARYLSRELDKGQLPSYVEKQVLAPRIDPIGRSSVNVKNDIVQQYGDSGYSQLIDDLYRQYRDAYDMPLIEFKSSRPNSFFSNVGSGQEAVEGTLFKEKFCLPGSECAKTSNAVTNKVFTEITGLPFAAQENAHNAWHLEDQMTRHGGKNVTEELAQGQLPKVGDRVLMGNDVNQSTFVPGYTADPEVRHAGFVAGYYPNSEGNLVPMIFESGKDSPLFLNPISNTFTGQNSVKQIIRPRQFLDNTFGKGLVDKNIRYAYRNKPSVAKYSSENETVQSLLSDAEQHRESIKRMHDLTNDEFDELLNSLIGIGAQETKLNAALPSGSLPAAKIKLQNTLADMGLTGPIKQTINLAKKTANTLTSKSSSLPKYPGTSFIEMESAKLADAQGIPFSEALKTIKSQYQPKPKFIPSTVEPSKGMFRQKFKTENARTSDFEHHITNDELGHGLSQMAENFSKIKKLYPEATPRQLIDLTTLMWNSPGKAQNKQLVDFYLLGKGNPNPAKFKFDYLNKVNKYKDQLINIHPQSTDSYREIFRAGYPEIQYKKGGSTKWLDKYQDGSQVPANLPWINQQGQFTQVPPVQPKSFERKVDEMLGSPQKKAWEKAKDIDNERHGLAGLYTQQKLQEYLDPVSAAAAANILGAAHEIANLPERIKNSKSASGVYHNLRETAEDMVNNAMGAGIGIFPDVFVPLEVKEYFLRYLSDNNMMPDGVSMSHGDMYWKKKKGGEKSPSLGYYEYIGGYSGIFAKGGVSSKKSSWLNKYK